MIWFVVNTLRPRQNGRHFPGDIFKCIFSTENIWISIEISLKFVPNGPINNIPALVQIMAWHRPGDKPLSEPMVVRLPTHICVTRPQWVKISLDSYTLTILTRRPYYNISSTVTNTTWSCYSAIGGTDWVGYVRVGNVWWGFSEWGWSGWVMSRGPFYWHKLT